MEQEECSIYIFASLICHIHMATSKLKHKKALRTLTSMKPSHAQNLFLFFTPIFTSAHHLVSFKIEPDIQEGPMVLWSTHSDLPCSAKKKQNNGRPIIGCWEVPLAR